MKLFLLICFIFFCHSTSFAQWTDQNSGITEDLNAIQMINSITGYIVGDNGTILKTINSGDDWTTLSSGTNIPLKSLYFIDDKIGFVAGNHYDIDANSRKGILLKTIDGGLNWVDMSFQFEEHITDIYFLNQSNGFASCGQEGLFKTTDGGENWSSVSLEYTKVTTFPSESIGYALMGVGIGKSIDGGENWNIIKDGSSPDYNTANILESLFLTSETEGFFGSPYYQGIYSTSDGGASLDFTSIVTYGLHFPTNNIGYAISTSDANQISQTIDAGLNWSQIHTADLRLSDIFFTTKSKGWAVGKQGTILHNSNTISNTNNSIDLDNQVAIYPNPSNGLIYLEIEEGLSINKLTICNHLGIVISEFDVNNSILDINDLPNGAYILRIETDKGNLTKKLIKK